MPEGDWTNPAAYEHMRAYDAAAFAAEYVMRNETFVAEFRAIAGEQKTSESDLVGSESFAARWGLRFRGGYRSFVIPGATDLDGGGASPRSPCSRSFRSPRAEPTRVQTIRPSTR